MAKSNAFETDLLELFFLGTAIADLAENDSTSPITTITVALHTASPGEAGDMSTNEADYANYARQTVVRNSSGWTVSGNSVINAAQIDFPDPTSGSQNITHVSMGTGISNDMKYYGALAETYTTTPGNPPRFPAGQLKLTED